MLLTVLVVKAPSPPKATIEQEVEKQLRDRERKLDESYADRLIRIHEDMGVPMTKRPETIEDVLNEASRIIFLPDTDTDTTE